VCYLPKYKRDETVGMVPLGASFSKEFIPQKRNWKQIFFFFFVLFFYFILIPYGEVVVDLGVNRPLP
jgi:hypothetical protein